MSVPTIDFLIYGAYGYTGKLIAREAVSKGYKPLLVGRDADKLQAMAREMQLEAVACDMQDTETLTTLLEAVPLVIHCAGPFIDTAEEMMRLCLATKTHYLDITGEYEVFEMAASLSAKAREAGIVLLPGVGFDVVPSDCLAAMLKDMLPDASHLELAFQSSKGGLSRGTALTMVRNAPEGGAIREDGKIKKVPAAYKTKEVDFGEGPRNTFSIPWGDVSTAWHSTGIPNVIVYTAAAPKMVKQVKMTRYFGWFLGLGFVQRFLQDKVKNSISGPSERAREAGETRLWGRVRNQKNEEAEARLITPDGYTLTATAAVAIASHLLNNSLQAGFHTPSTALGAEFILQLPGTKRL